LIFRANTRTADDASKVSSKLKDELPGKGKEAQKSAESLAAQAGSKFDSAVSLSVSIVRKLH
jgi:hypothetical protein